MCTKDCVIINNNISLGQVDKYDISMSYMLYGGRVMVFNATFNNISIISWR